MSDTTIDAKSKRDLVNLLTELFPQRGDIAQLTDLYLNKPLSSIPAEGTDTRSIILGVVNWCLVQGGNIFASLLEGAVEERPHRDDLRTLVNRLNPEISDFVQQESQAAQPDIDGESEQLTASSSRRDTPFKKLYTSISELTLDQWEALLATVDIENDGLPGSSHLDKIRSLIIHMTRTGWIDILEEAVKERSEPKELEKDEAISQQIASLLSQLVRADYYYARGRVYHKQRDFKRAIVRYTRAIYLAPQRDDYYYVRGLSYHANQDYIRAISDYRAAINLAPKQAKYYYARGISYGANGNYNRAITDYTQAIRLAPKQARYYHTRGLSYHNLGEHNKALSDYSQAIDLAPSRSIYYYNRSLAHLTEGNINEARNDAKSAVHLGLRSARRLLQALSRM